MSVADWVIGAVVLTLGVIVVIGAGFALARSEWRSAFLELFILGVFVIPMVVSRLHRYAAARRSKSSHRHPDSN
jgi:ABC-type spermidine/putrescine transport system permease subunit II